MRGGSQALLIDEKFYLSFFHTQTHLAKTGLTTYFFGAYTFSSRPPFVLKGVSRFPIVDKVLYSSKWNTRFPMRKIDYVIFPMSVFRINDILYLTVGYQDEYGWLLTLSLSEVMNSLRNVST